MGLDAAQASETLDAGQAGSAETSGLAAIQVTYYTDPLCPWSWALEPQWRRLRFEYGGQLTWRYVMGGMVADWRTYHDPLNAVHNPSQMGLQCYQARQQTGMPFDALIWHDDPPSSSYPACLAVKAAGRQGQAAGEAYLRRVREAVMVGRRNVALGDVLLDLAEDLAAEPPPGVVFDAELFREEIVGTAVRDQFHADLQEVRYRSIGRFPTLVLSTESGPSLAVVGYRPYGVFRDAILQIRPDLRPLRQATDPVAFVAHWHGANGREVAEALDLEHDAALEQLHAAVAANALRHDGAVTDSFRPAGDK